MWLINITPVIYLQVLLVADDAEVRKLITTTRIVTEKLSLLSQSRTMQDLVNRFKVNINELAEVHRLITTTRIVTEKLSLLS